MMDAVSMEAKETILLGDFNIDLLRQNAPWTNMINTYHLRQVITRPARVTASSESLIDHIYVSDVNNAIEHCVPASACSDHYPVCLTRKGAKTPSAGHKTATYRNFANFDENNFIRDLITSPLSMVLMMPWNSGSKRLIVSKISMHPSKPRELSRKRNPNGYQLNCKKQSISAIY